MATRRYTWRLEVPTGWDVDRVRDELLDPATRMRQLNRWVSLVEIELYDDHVLLSLTLTGHDQWWIKRRAPALIAGLAVQSGIGTNMVRHVSIDTPPTLKNARFRTEDGKRVFYLDGEPEPGPSPSAAPCVACRDPAHYHWRRGWRTGSAVEWGRGR